MSAALDALDNVLEQAVDDVDHRQLLDTRGLEEGTNVLLLGPPGVGKTALAVGLGMKALEARHRISFLACHDLVIRHRRACRSDREHRKAGLAPLNTGKEAQ